MGSLTSHEAQDESVTESSTSEQNMAGAQTVILQNGPTVGNHSQNSVQIDSVADVKQDTGTFTSKRTMEISANTDAEEKELVESAKPVSKSRFSMSFSRSVPGRTNGPSTEPISGTEKLQANQGGVSVNTASVDTANLQASSSLSSAQKQQQLSNESTDAVEHTVKETEQPKQKEISFFDKLFKQGDKSKLQNENQGDLKAAGSQDTVDAEEEATELVHRLDITQHYLETGDSSRDHTTSSHGGQVSENSASKSSEDFKESEKDDKAEVPADDNSVMNFFKTLVTPTKSSSKSEVDPQKASDDKKKVNGEHKEAAAKSHKFEQKAAQQEIAKTNGADSSDKAKLEKSPTQSPFGKLFRQKTIKEVPQVEQENVTSTSGSKAEKGTSQPQRQMSKQEIKSLESAQKIESEEEEVKPAKKGFLDFFKQMSVKEEEKHADSAKVSEEKDSGLADDATKKGKDSSKQRKSSSEASKEEPQRTKSVEALSSSQQANVVSASIPNGNNIKAGETPEKKLEKKSSFGVFLKQLGGKRTADAGVQTDPVVIYPAGKTK